MSLKALTWAWEQHGISHIDKIILLAVADHASPGGDAFPSLKTLVKKTGISKSTLCKHLTDLEDRGYLVRTQRTYGEVMGDGTESGGPVATLYTLNLVPETDRGSPAHGLPPSIESLEPSIEPCKTAKKIKPKSERKWSYTPDELSGKFPVEISSARGAIAFWLDSVQHYIDTVQRDDLPSVFTLGGEGRKMAVIRLWRDYPARYVDIVRTYCTEQTRRRLVDEGKGQYFLSSINVKYEARTILQQLRSETPTEETMSSRNARALIEQQESMKAKAAIDREKRDKGELSQIVNPFERNK